MQQDLENLLAAALQVGPYTALAFGIFFAAYCIRRWKPTWWKKLTMDSSSDLIQSIPVVLIGLIAGGATPLEVEYTALSSLVAIGIHHLLKLSPAKYRGAVKDIAGEAADKWLEAKKRASLTGLFLLSSCLLLTGCPMFVKTIKTADDAAKMACEIFFAERQGISIKEAAAAYCATREALEPWLGAQELAGKQAAEKMGLPAK